MGRDRDGSGQCGDRTVVNEDMLASVDIVEGEAFRKGVQYEVASGTLIPNQGE